MPTYKTPDVYVEEISKFPPSVAQVETAIPAFIGYTEKAERRNGDSLLLVPLRIQSLLDYETYFGKACPETGFSVDIIDNQTNGVSNRTIKVVEPSDSDKKPFLMYYALQLYFANGGGPCYIASVGDYSNPSISMGELKKGLDKIRKTDEPTLLLFPDATKLSSKDNFYAIFNDALSQCKDLKDRFTIIDTWKDDQESIDDLRNKIHNDLELTKYGAVYFPFLDTILDYLYDADTVLINHLSYEANAIPLIKQNIAKINDATTGIPSKIPLLFALSDIDTDNTNDTITGSVIDLLAFMENNMNLKDADPDNYIVTPGVLQEFVTKLNTLQSGLNELIALKTAMKNEANAAIASLDEPSSGAARTNIQTALAAFVADFEGADKIEEVSKELVEIKNKFDKAKGAVNIKRLLKHSTSDNFHVSINKLITTNFTIFPNNALAANSIFDNIITNTTALVNSINPAEGMDVNNGVLNGRYLGDIINLDNSTFNIIKNEIANIPLRLPPSSAIAGIYARIDNDRGVWKSPANVSLNYVMKPSVIISFEDQESMNVHPTGKSINAIRAFTGKGTLVWGARTLAGNDNEWRYINVRRFFNFAEESIKKATEPFVFEPNDANTWAKVKSMIVNFLTLQWRDGALQGAKPDHAFYVKIGLGETMTALDILEGRMIVEVGMAVVRPAEFIILRFSHKLPES